MSKTIEEILTRHNQLKKSNKFKATRNNRIIKILDRCVK